MLPVDGHLFFIRLRGTRCPAIEKTEFSDRYFRGKIQKYISLYLNRPPLYAFYPFILPFIATALIHRLFFRTIFLNHLNPRATVTPFK